MVLAAGLEDAERLKSARGGQGFASFRKTCSGGAAAPDFVNAQKLIGSRGRHGELRPGLRAGGAVAAWLHDTDRKRPLKSFTTKVWRSSASMSSVTTSSARARDRFHERQPGGEWLLRGLTAHDDATMAEPDHPWHVPRERSAIAQEMR